MPKYVIWDKHTSIMVTSPDWKTGKQEYTAQEYIEEKAKWAGLPEAKVIICGEVGLPNGTYFENFYERVTHYKLQGVEINLDTMTDRQILDAMEEYDLNPISKEVVTVMDLLRQLID